MNRPATDSLTLEEKAEILLERFANRRDIYTVQWADDDRHGYRAVRERLTVDVAAKHLRGELTLAVYALGPDSTAKWMAIDADTTVVEELEKIVERYRKLGLPEPVREFSGRRGYHFVWFFSEPVNGWKARTLCERAAREHESFPKGDRVSQDTSSPGACLKLPCGWHRATEGDWSVLVDRHFRELSDPWKRLREVEPVDIEDYEHLLERRERRRAETGGNGWGVQVLRPCLKQILANGCREGARNQTAHVIASEMRRLGCSADTAIGVLCCWNLRNVPDGLPREELATVVQSAYSGEPYTYSCRPDGPLRKLLESGAVGGECVGENHCEYMQAVRRRRNAQKSDSSTR